MKKILIIFLCMLLTSKVSAENIVTVPEVKFKWYKIEKLEGFYHPKKDKLEEYIEDEFDIKYSNYSEWNSKYCNYSKENYLIEEKNITTYEKIVKTKYIKIEPSISCDNCINEIKIYSEMNSIEYKIIQDDKNGIKLELPNEYDTEKLWFYIDTDNRYSIYLLNNYDSTVISLGYYVMPYFDGKILIPNKKWILNGTVYIEEQTEENILESPFIKNIKKNIICRVREINTYRYKIQKKYYDDNYYSYIDNYIPDIENYTIYYNENTSNMQEEKEILKKEYVCKAREQDNLDKEKDNEKLNLTSNNNEKIIYKTKYIDKIKEKIPNKIYAILFILLLIIIVETLKLMKKKVN